MAQQIIIADTTTLANRALLTSTISIPWLLTTWLGAPLGGWFQAQGERGYRSVYLTFGILTFLSAIFLVVTLALEWRRVKRKLIEVKSMTVVNVREEDVGWRDPERLARKREEWVVKSFRSSAASVWRQLDIVGLATLTFGCSLVLIPLTLSAQGIFKDRESVLSSRSLRYYQGLTFLGELKQLQCISLCYSVLDAWLSLFTTKLGYRLYRCCRNVCLRILRSSAVHYWDSFITLLNISTLPFSPPFCKCRVDIHRLLRRTLGEFLSRF